MTDIELLKDIKTDLKVFLQKDGIKMLLGDTFSDINVYEQDLPFKQDEDYEGVRNYIVIMVGDQDVEDDAWKTEIHFSINLEDDEQWQNSASINVLYLMNEIYAHFIKTGIVGKHCRMEQEAHKRLNHEMQWPYAQGDLITYWKLPLPNEEGLEDLI